MILVDATSKTHAAKMTFGNSTSVTQRISLNVLPDKFIGPKTATRLSNLMLKIGKLFNHTHKVVEIEAAPNKLTKKGYIESLIKAGKKEGIDYKVTDLPHCKTIEEIDLETNTKRVIRLRNDDTISLIAEYDNKSKMLQQYDRYDETGNKIPGKKQKK